MIKMDNQLLSIGKAARILGVSIKTLQRWDKNGKFTSLRMGDKGNRYYRRFDIDLLTNNQLALVQKWVMSTLGYDPDPQYFCKTRDIFQVRLEHFQSNLVKIINPNLASLISAI